MSGAVALQLNFSCYSKPHKNVSDCRAVIGYAEHLCMSCSFQVVLVSTYAHLSSLSKKDSHGCLELW